MDMVLLRSKTWYSLATPHWVTAILYVKSYMSITDSDISTCPRRYKVPLSRYRSALNFVPMSHNWEPWPAMTAGDRIRHATTLSVITEIHFAVHRKLCYENNNIHIKHYTQTHSSSSGGMVGGNWAAPGERICFDVLDGRSNYRGMCPTLEHGTWDLF